MRINNFYYIGDFCKKYILKYIIFNAIKNKDSKNARKQVYHHLAGVKKDLLRN